MRRYYATLDCDGDGVIAEWEARRAYRSWYGYLVKATDGTVAIRSVSGYVGAMLTCRLYEMAGMLCHTTCSPKVCSVAVRHSQVLVEILTKLLVRMCKCEFTFKIRPVLEHAQ